MTKNDFDNFLHKALALCDDYSTTEPDSDTVEHIWFTPAQLKKYTEYCLRKFQNKKK